MKKYFISLILISFSCNPSDEVTSLSGGWKFVSEGKYDRAIDGGNQIIPCEVVEYGYSNDFIIAAQRPAKDCFLGKDTTIYKEGRDKIYYWLIIHNQSLSLGPMNALEFENAKKQYGVPDKLKMKPI